jgi:hypothetical protein
MIRIPPAHYSLHANRGTLLAASEAPTFAVGRGDQTDASGVIRIKFSEIELA